ncbi:hypothetical protein EZV62_024277 [Acer yangbiense]|uniref:Arf-GAP domain-containing protein n=1 Tax=Acer yangbiense TaxID=1000413 RepID=A0A5C7H429_9ROSI|nr:hypothetical protein EZV62_024277 [Acer yangbiense]
MNQKASVSKELNARHNKILEGLLKLGENRECADCQSRNPSKSWSAYFTGTIYHSGYVATGAAMGNDKSNKYWEAQLPPDCDRRSFEKFIRAKYAEKRWVRKGETQAIPIPRRTRNLSLEEKILTQHMSQITPPPLRSRKGSLDMSIANTPAVANKDHSHSHSHSPSPSLWATFD